MNIHNKYLSYANQVSEAVSNIVEDKLRNRIMHDYEAIPLLFFFRHCLELYFKGFNYYLNYLGCRIIIYNKGKKGHNIIIPFKEILNVIKRFGIREPNSNVKDLIEKIGTIDKDGQGWRYPESVEGSYNHDQEEFAVSVKYDKTNKILQDIKETINWCINVEGYLDSYLKNLEDNQN